MTLKQKTRLVWVNNVACLYVVYVAFTESETGEISAGLEQYLESIAATGQTQYVS